MRRLLPTLAVLALAALPAAAAPSSPPAGRDAVVVPAEPPTHGSPDGKLEVQFLVGPHAAVGRKGPAAAPGCAMQRLRIGPGGQVPPHVHADADEILTIHAGTGTFLLGEARIPVGPGSTLFIPKGQRHAFLNGPANETLATQVYDPAGPEARFLAWPRKGTAPAGK